MKNGLSLTTLLAAFAGCATDAQLESFRQTEIQLLEARAQASALCATALACARGWTLTQTYVAQHSKTPIRRADDSVIETAMPHTFGVAYFWAEKNAGEKGSATIRLKGMCRGMYSSDGGPGWMYATCAEQIRAGEMDFRRFVGETP
jgi:hypothetical protein